MGLINLSINIGNNMHGFDWGNFVTTMSGALFGALFGSFSGYKLNKCFEEYKLKERKKALLLFLVHYTFNSLDSMLSFKGRTLVPAIQSLVANNYNPTGIQILSNIEFNIDIKEYYFLLSINEKMYHLILKIQNEVNLLRKDIVLINEMTIGGEIYNKPICEMTLLDTDNIINGLNILFNSFFSCPYKNVICCTKDTFTFYNEEEKRSILETVNNNPNLLKGWDDVDLFWNNKYRGF